jgi:DNA repair protein RadD
MKALKAMVPSARFINVAHVKELLVQNSGEMQRIWSDAPFGIYAAGLHTKESDKDITYASIQSAVKNLPAFGKQQGLFIDEAHLLSPGEETNYQKLIRALRERNPYMFVAGYSATPWRMKHGLLTEGNIFNTVAFDNTSREKFTALIDDGYLCPLIPKHTSFQFDVSQVRILAGEFNRSDLERVVNRDELTLQALQEALQCATRRKHWLIFCSGIDHVESVHRMLTAMGESAVYCHSRMGEKNRDLAIAIFKAGGARMIVSEGILTTGFNSPWVDCIVMLRPTSSPGLHVQILGRGTRPYYATGDQFDLETTAGRLDAIESSEKQNCLVLDFAGNTERLGPINDPRIPQLKIKGGPGNVPVKICPVCGTYVHAARRFCDGINWDDSKCNHEFEFDTKLEQTASTAEIIARDAPYLLWFKVDRVEYQTYKGRKNPQAPPMMRINYYCGLRRFTEYVGIENPKSAGIAKRWWKTRMARLNLPDVPPPPTTEKGMTYVTFLPWPTYIHVWLNAGSHGQYENVMGHHWDDTTPQDLPHAA